MNQQYPSKAVQYWADNQLVVSGNHCRLIDNCTQKNLFQFDASSVSDAFEKCYQFLSFGRIA
jgi:hypothetical protein